MNETNKKEGAMIAKNSWISIGLALTIFASLVTYAVFNERRLATLEALIETHRQNKSIHYEGLGKFMDEFVPRGEIDARLENIEKTLSRIEGRLDR